MFVHMYIQYVHTYILYVNTYNRTYLHIYIGTWNIRTRAYIVRASYILVLT
jgi:hypothetical protein